jgi:putative ABC transport system permease protein
MGLGFSLSILLVSVVVTTLAAWILNGLSKRKVNGIGFRFSLRNLARGGVATITSILALSIGSLILVLMPQIRSSLTSEIKRPPTGELPSLFLFDIQPEQLEGLKLFAKEEGFELQTVSPLIRARLESVNGKGFDKANVNESRFFREEEQEDRTRNRTYNLTYRGELSKSEEIIAGKYVGEWKSSEVAPISVEERFAENLGVKLGDVLKFDVQGVEIEGRVESLRRVRWTSFQPNFFVQFPNGVLNEAPQIYLASVPPMDIKTKSTFQMGVVRKFSNISMIDVDRTLEKLLKIVDLISVVLNAMALLSIIVGFFVLTSILVDQLSRRERDVVLLKLLGADFKTIRKTLIREYWMLSLTGACTGAFFGIGLAWLLTKYVFEGVWQSDLVSAMTVIVGLFLVSDLITRTLVERTLRRTRTVVSL